jgi:hypothetical protein
MNVINLLQKNIEMESPRTNSTFGFCQHAKCQSEKTKRAILFPAHGNNLYFYSLIRELI